MLMVVIPIDPQSQGREAARGPAEGGDGREACQDQGRARTETGARAAEAEPDGRRRGRARGRAVEQRDVCVTMNNGPARFPETKDEQRRGRQKGILETLLACTWEIGWYYIQRRACCSLSRAFFCALQMIMPQTTSGPYRSS